MIELQKIIMRKILFGVLSCLLLCSLNSTSLGKNRHDMNDGTNQKWVSIATISMDRKLVIKIVKAFRNANINTRIGGSLGYGVSVHVKDRNRALRILHAITKDDKSLIVFGKP